MVNTILKEADLFCPNSVRINFTIYLVSKFNSLSDFYNAQVKQMVTENDEIGISYFGMELDSLNNTSSTNTLYLDESPFTEDGDVKGNLKLVLDGQILSVQHVRIDAKWKAELAESDVSLSKVDWVSND